MTTVRLEEQISARRFPQARCGCTWCENTLSPAVRRALGAFCPFGLVLSPRAFPYLQLLEDTDCKLKTLLKENYVLIPYWLRGGRMRLRGLIVPLRTTGWCVDSSAWEVQHIYVGGQDWPLDVSTKNLSHWLSDFIRQDFVMRYRAVQEEIAEAVQAVILPACPDFEGTEECIVP